MLRRPPSSTRTDTLFPSPPRFRSGFGHFALILSTAEVISSIVSFESWQVIVKFGQEHVQNSDTERFGRLFGFCIAIDLCGAIVGCLIAALATFLLGP